MAKDGYPVRFEKGLFEEGSAVVAQTLREVSGAEVPRVLLVADANVVQRTNGLGTRIGKYVQTHRIELAGAPVVLGGGEKIKSDGLQSVQRVMQAILAAKLGPSDLVMAIGGGTLLDVAGYAAAQVRGAAKVVRVPTTVASMVDGAFSEVAALDFQGVKDALGVAVRPAAVLIDTTFARTVLDGVWRGGLGEIVRLGLALSGPLLKKVAKAAEAVRARDFEALDDLMAEAVAVRRKKGATDFALWGAHRLEAMSCFKLPHGYAVPIAIVLDCAYARERGLLSEADQEMAGEILTACGALDGMAHSQHLMAQGDALADGFDQWRRQTGATGPVLPTAPGKLTVDGAFDAELYRRVVKEFHAVSTSL